MMVTLSEGNLVANTNDNDATEKSILEAIKQLEKLLLVTNPHNRNGHVAHTRKVAGGLCETYASNTVEGMVCRVVRRVCSVILEEHDVDDDVDLMDLDELTLLATRVLDEVRA